jgi:hypothetical protein
VTVLPVDFIVQQFYLYAGFPKYNRLSKTYYGSCPTCREGNSWGKKRRLFYIERKNLIYCHNCGLSMAPIKWIQTVSNKSYSEVLKEANSFVPKSIDLDSIEKKVNFNNSEILPEDSINLMDHSQINFYKDNMYVKAALELLAKRRLTFAINRPDSFYISLNKGTHQNRLVIPFKDLDGKIVHYQSRSIIENKKFIKPKYLSKINSEKTLFGIDRVREKTNYIFVTEGPLDACFIRNGVAVAGITKNGNHLFTDRQKQQLKMFPQNELVWVLDNQKLDATSKSKSLALIKQGYKVFIWPEELKKIKDINDLCINYNLNKISTSFILKNSFTDLKARVILT